MTRDQLAEHASVIWRSRNMWTVATGVFIGLVGYAIASGVVTGIVYVVMNAGDIQEAVRGYIIG